MTPVEFDRVVPAVNPESTNAHRIQKEVIDPLNASGFVIDEVIETNDCSPDDNAEAIAEKLTDGDVLVCCGGDGMAHICTNATVMADVESRVLFLPYGGYNDAARAFGPASIDTLRNGSELSVTTIEVDDGERRRYAINYFSLGITAIIAAAANEPEYREQISSRGAVRKFFSDVGIATRHGLNPGYFTYTDGSGDEQTVHELMYGNGFTAARHLRLGGRHDNPDIRRFVLPFEASEDGAFASYGNYLGALATNLARGVLGRGLPGDTITADVFTTSEATAAQIDGEPYEVPADTTVEINAVPESLVVVSR